MSAVAARSRIPAEPERQFQAAVVQLARTLGYRVQYTHDSRRSPEGWPDLAICRPPRLIFAELKSARGRVTPDQQAWLDDLAACERPEAFLWRAGETRLTDIAEILRGGA